MLKKLISVLLLLSIFTFSCGPTQEEKDQEEADDLLTTLLLLFIVLPDPTVRIRNSSGGAENYSIMGFSTSGSCSSTVVVTYPENPVANGGITSYQSVPAGGYSIRFNTGQCAPGPYNFTKGSTYTCTSGTTTITCATP